MKGSEELLAGSQLNISDRHLSNSRSSLIEPSRYVYILFSHNSKDCLELISPFPIRLRCLYRRFHQ